jgi:hypothetical protein
LDLEWQFPLRKQSPKLAAAAPYLLRAILITLELQSLLVPEVYDALKDALDRATAPEDQMGPL